MIQINTEKLLAIAFIIIAVISAIFAVVCFSYGTIFTDGYGFILVITALTFAVGGIYKLIKCPQSDIK